MYDVGGIPHMQWNGIFDVVGAGVPWTARYEEYYPMVVDYYAQETPLEIEITGPVSYTHLTLPTKRIV